MSIKAVVLSAALTAFASANVNAEETLTVDLDAFEAALVADCSDTDKLLKLIQDTLTTAKDDEAMVESIIIKASENGCADSVTILAAVVAAGIDPGIVAQILADTATAAGPTAPGAAPGAGPAAGSASSLPPPPPGFGGGGGGGGGTISGN